ncbi:MAG: hypothetical protein P4M14_00525 [Gammaproteobacteria bacterium]|nr:hypothetical protein [Gammaproteobacteria bacterium]
MLFSTLMKKSNQYVKHLIGFSLLFSFATPILATTTSPAVSHVANNAENKDETPPTIGNFVLPFSQQPGPLVSFGENTVNKNQTQLFLFADDYVGVREHYADVVPALLYGITDSLTVFFNLPVAASYRQRNHHSAGLEDAFAQFEYNYYSKSTKRFTDQATFVASISVPTGSTQKNPQTGNGSPAFFFGGTFNRTYVDWFAFTSYGATLTTTNDETKMGNQFVYQAGIGRNICNTGKDWLFAWMVEGDGTYSTKNRINGITDPNSGGNVVYVTPSFWVSSKKLIFQAGVGLPVTQHWNGDQNSSSYLVVSNIIWTLD